MKGQDLLLLLKLVSLSRQEASPFAVRESAMARAPLTAAAAPEAGLMG